MRYIHGSKAKRARYGQVLPRFPKFVKVSSMELSRLAAKQKRYRDISLFTLGAVQEPNLKSKLRDTLSSYSSALANCWKRQAITPEDIVRLDSLERELETLCGEVRLRAAR